MKFDKNWYSQAGQDKWIAELFKYKKNGYFLDIGAGDGIGDNNTYYIEKELDWDGLCIECSVRDIIASKPIRKKIAPYALWNKEANLSFTQHNFKVQESGIGLPVKAITPSMLFEKYNVPEVIDYVSLDVEEAEIEILKVWPFEKHKVIAWTIEHNLYLTNNSKMKDGIHEIMIKNNYVRAVENVACHDSKWGAFEDWYIHKDYVYLNNDVNLNFIKISNYE